LQKRGKHVGVCGFEGWVTVEIRFLMEAAGSKVAE
jgi:hypothetical protein